MEPAENAVAGGSDGKAIATRSPICFLLPAFKTPLLTSDLLHAANESGLFQGCPFALLLEASDPHLLTYRTTVERLREDGMTLGFFIFDGTPYCGAVNRVAPIIDAEAFCVIDGRHMPFTDGKKMADAVVEWLASSAEPMRVGSFTEDGAYPVVTRKLIDRLGYMFHPLAKGRIEAENWLLSLGTALGVRSIVPGCRIVESQADAVEIIGSSDEEDIRWTDATLEQILDDECERLEKYLVR